MSKEVLGLIKSKALIEVKEMAASTSARFGPPAGIQRQKIATLAFNSWADAEYFATLAEKNNLLVSEFSGLSPRSVNPLIRKFSLSCKGQVSNMGRHYSVKLDLTKMPEGAFREGKDLSDAAEKALLFFTLPKNDGFLDVKVDVPRDVQMILLKALGAAYPVGCIFAKPSESNPEELVFGVELAGQSKAPGMNAMNAFLYSHKVTNAFGGVKNLGSFKGENQNNIMFFDSKQINILQANTPAIIADVKNRIVDAMTRGADHDTLAELGQLLSALDKQESKQSPADLVQSLRDEIPSVYSSHLEDRNEFDDRAAAGGRFPGFAPAAAAASSPAPTPFEEEDEPMNMYAQAMANSGDEPAQFRSPFAAPFADPQPMLGHRGGFEFGQPQAFSGAASDSHFFGADESQFMGASSWRGQDNDNFDSDR